MKQRQNILGSEIRLVEIIFLLRSLFMQNTQKYVIFLLKMNRNTKVEFIQKDQVLQEETKEQKKFVQNNISIDYCNTSKIFTQNSPNLSDIRVNNYLCYQEGQTLYKVTQILYEDKLIRIEDKFDVAPNSICRGSLVSVVEEKNQIKEKNCSRNIQKVRLFCKNVSKATATEKKDKKNIVKNIIKIFVSWLEKHEQSQQEKDALEQLVKLLKTQNYNNRLIKKIVTDSQTSKSFLKFLLDSASEQIKYSRIQDKESHYEALQIYKSLLQNNMNGNQSLSLSSNEPCSEQQSANNNEKKRQCCSNMESGATSSGGSKSGQAKVENKSQNANQCRKNRVILINDGLSNQE